MKKIENEFKVKMENQKQFEERLEKLGYKLRWLDTVFQGQYLPSLSINYVTINKGLENLPPQLY